MKKKILFLLLFIPSVLSGREFLLNIEDITGTDTTIYLEARKADLVTFDFTSFNADDAILDLGQSDDHVSFVTSVSSITLPVTLSKVTYTKTANGYTRSRIAFEPYNNWNGIYIVFTLTKSSVTSGTLKVIY